MKYLINTPKDGEYFTYLSSDFNFDSTLFDVEPDFDTNEYIEGYNRMQLFLEKRTIINEIIHYYVISINGFVMGAISAFVNFVPNQTKNVDETTHRELNLYKSIPMNSNFAPIGVYQHVYTLHQQSGIYFGRTIIRVDLGMELPEDNHLH